MRAEIFLLDTSIWIEVLPPGKGSPALRERVDALLSTDSVATTGMVQLELLGGARSQEEWDRLRELMSAPHSLPVEDEDWVEAAHMGFQLRKQGITVPFTDLLISEVTIRSGAVLVHRDRHFDLIASHLPLLVESYVAF